MCALGMIKVVVISFMFARKRLRVSRLSSERRAMARARPDARLLSLCNMKIGRVRHFARLDYFARAMACDANCFLSVVSHTCCQELLLLRRPFVL